MRVIQLIPPSVYNLPVLGRSILPLLVHEFVPPCKQILLHPRRIGYRGLCSLFLDMGIYRESNINL
jgi:hypothetical protein